MQIKVKKYARRRGYTRIYPVSGGPSAFVASSIVIQRRGTTQDNRPRAERGQLRRQVGIRLHRESPTLKAKKKETAPKVNAVIFCALQSIFGGSLIGHVYHHTVVVGLYV